MSGGKLTLTPVCDAHAVERALVELRTLESELRVMVSQHRARGFPCAGFDPLELPPTLASNAAMARIHKHVERLTGLVDAMAEETARAMVVEGSA